MTSVTRWTLRCASCAHVIHPQSAAHSCPACGSLLEVVHVGPWPLAGDLRRSFDARFGFGPSTERSGVWRYRELLFDVADTEIVSLHEGNTALLEHPRVTAYAGTARLWMKHEGMNPTGSFKDRGMTAGLTRAMAIGAKGVACASTGNTSASLAAYAARAGLPAFVFVPSGQVALGKLTQTLAYGARTILIQGDFDACLALVREVADELGVYLLNSVNPFRIEGQKTIAIELLHELGWSVPDWIALPAGNLGNTAAVGKALFELHEAGVISRLPRVLAVQASGAAPFVASFESGFSTQRTAKAETVATAIKIGNPASYHRAVEVIRRTNGAVLAVSDEAILDAKAVIDAAGIGCEPASAASVAGARAAIGRGLIQPHETVAAILTGHVLKDPGVLSWYHRDADPAPRRANRPVEVAPSREAIVALLRDVTG
ncbi:MAG: threonine synthase [Gemmatimonadaceae bacterium]